MFTPTRNTTRGGTRRKSSILQNSSLQQRGILSGSRNGTPRSGSFMDQSSQILLEETDLHVFGILRVRAACGGDGDDLFVRKDVGGGALFGSTRTWAWESLTGNSLFLLRICITTHASSTSFLRPQTKTRLLRASPFSPEGVIRYWSSIAHEGSSTEITADLQGQESWMLADIQPVGSLLGTTTSTLLLIRVSSHSRITCRLLQSPQGLLGGIGRRVTSLFWGSMNPGNNGSPESKLIRVFW
ncbi:NUP133 [Lepeophtheirus salmonis]|uniref:NUP133 n=1 Tax=Lepeophtheirus salmonis TaxID=72036 RepID=A0A7R8CP58_LEPSM|nr:NUP133 [Lepeophtheirus salmonis]CAF2846976.1 NUP133 [Lepeophtheirus salmonis]